MSGNNFNTQTVDPQDQNPPPQQPQQPQQDDRYTALEDRLSRLTQVLETVQSRETQREQQSEVQRQQRQIEQLEREAAGRVQEATTRLQQAYDESDAAKIAAATAALSAATTEQTAARMQVESFKRQAQQAQQQQREQPQQPQRSVDDTNLRNWRQRNANWYGVDPDMTTKALQIAKQVEGEKILEVGSTAYFNAIDARLRREFPDKMGQATPPSAHVNTQRGSPMGQQPAQQGERIPASIADGFRRMGLDVDNPEVAKQLIDARKLAVSKGFLPEKPTIAPVITR